MLAPAEAAITLKELRASRRRHRLEGLDWMDAAYHAYLAAVVGIALTLFLSSIVGGTRVGASTMARVEDHGPAMLGVLAALALAAGVRSGSRGGPLAVEPAEVRFVLLAPVDRARALRPAAWRALRFAAFVGAVVGGIGGQLAVRRLGGAPLAWVATDALFGAVVAVLAVSAALVASGVRLPRWAGTLIGAAVLGWAVLDAAEVFPGPFRYVGAIATAPLELQPAALAAIAVVAGLAALGVALLGGVSLEAAERRTRLVSQLRFAVTLQDLRTVILLRRQLALDLPRQRPWLHTAAHRPPRSTWTRDLRGVLRFPLPRILRLVACGAVAGAAGWGVWHGAQPLVIVAGVALYVAALDAVEGLAQEVDQDDRLDSWPRERGTVLVRHLPLATVVMLIVAGIGAGLGALLGFSRVAVEVAAVAWVPAALGAAAGAAVSVVSGVPRSGEDGQLLPPEVAGMKIALRTAWPVILSVIGVLPVLIGHRAQVRGTTPPVPATATAAVFALIPSVITGLWVRFREPAHAWWDRLVQDSQSASDQRRQRAGATS